MCNLYKIETKCEITRMGYIVGCQGVTLHLSGRCPQSKVMGYMYTQKRKLLCKMKERFDVLCFSAWTSNCVEWMIPF